MFIQTTQHFFIGLKKMKILTSFYQTLHFCLIILFKTPRNYTIIFANIFFLNFNKSNYNFISTFILLKDTEVYIQ